MLAAVQRDRTNIIPAALAGQEKLVVLWPQESALILGRCKAR
jgi:hypothetical protein